MEIQSFKEPPKLICPECEQNITDPKWRGKCLLDPRGLICPCGKVKLRMSGNHWYGLLFGCGLMLLGGRLWSSEYPVLFCFLFLILGIGALGWGIVTSHLIVIGQAPEPPTETENSP